MTSSVPVCFTSLPAHVGALIVSRSSSDFVIFVNSDLDLKEQGKSLAHELAHLDQGHLYASASVAFCEAAAERAAAAHIGSHKKTAGAVTLALHIHILCCCTAFRVRSRFTSFYNYQNMLNMC